MLELILFGAVFLSIFKFKKDINLLKQEILLLKNQKNMVEQTKIEEKNTSPSRQTSLPPTPKPMNNNALYTNTIKPSFTTTHSNKPEKKAPQEYTKSPFDKLGEFFMNYFTTGNIIVRIGGVVLFFGLAFLAKYAAEHSMVSIEVRLFSIAIMAVFLIGLGWRLRQREGYYGLILQGLGVAVFYLVIYASAKIYLLMPLLLAFALMLCVVIVGVALSVRQNALPLALFSIVGGFATPILTSDGSGSHITLFSYYALLNFGIFLIAWYRSWRVLNVTGFFFTFVIALIWGTLRYESEFLLSSELFLLLFYFFYLAVSVLFTHKQEFSFRAPIDTTLVFGLPIVAFGIQVSLVAHIQYALAGSAFVLGSLYLGLYFLLRSKEKMKLLSLSFLGLSIIFYTITLPYLFDDRLTATLWALEGAGVVFVSLRQNQTIARYFGQILVVVATLLYLVASNPFSQETSLLAYINTTYLGYLFIMLSTFFIAYMLDKNITKLTVFEKYNSTIFLALGVAIWLISGLHEAQNISQKFGNTMLLYLGVWGAIFGAIALYFSWKNLQLFLEGYFLLGVLFLISIGEHYLVSHPFEGIGSVALSVFFATHYLLLYLHGRSWKNQPFFHLLSLWLIVILLALESTYLASLLSEYAMWQLFAWMGVIMAFASVLFFKKKFLPHFFKDQEELYKNSGQIGLMLLLFVSLLYSFSFTAMSELGYIPFFNPLEAMTCGVFFLIYKWLTRQNFEDKKLLIGLLLGVGVLFLSVVLARLVHLLLDIRYELFSLLKNMEFQMGISLLWGLLALGAILYAKKLQSRLIWIAGASLMGIVVIKLFLVELSKSGSIERIISFIAIGVLLLLVGYFAPLPPKCETQPQDN
jgi:uncharacterized membrane protein